MRRRPLHDALVGMRRIGWFDELDGAAVTGAEKGYLDNAAIFVEGLNESVIVKNSMCSVIVLHIQNLANGYGNANRGSDWQNITWM